jgi:nitric oxide reductase NorD protein
MSMTASPLLRDLSLLVEASAADHALAGLLPGLAKPINELRHAALAARPLLSVFPKAAQPLENFLRIILRSDCREALDPALRSASPTQSIQAARKIVAELLPAATAARAEKASLLLKDGWTGELYAPPETTTIEHAGFAASEDDNAASPPSGRLARRPRMRQAEENEDDTDEEAGPWMVQADEPHEKAEDPMGLGRPTDRSDESGADELADMLAEIPEARQIATPERPREVLLSDDAPQRKSRSVPVPAGDEEQHFSYPEWDYREQAYREPGATVRSLCATTGLQSWVDATMDRHRSMLDLIRRRFEMLRARRITLRRQRDGDEIDLEACIDALADLRAGAEVTDGLYRSCRPAERSMAINLLIDVSGSTDSWIAAHRRVIDVEREALLLVCIALREMAEPYAVQAFSGEGPQGVTIHTIKRFDEPFGNTVALRIAALEPERYTRAGAAIRHATALLMQQPAEHRLLLLLSDGKPNDIDEYEGRYGVEDMQQAVTEARLQGIFPFCLTIDRQATNYLPRIFGANQYALLPVPELLPTILLDWMRRLLAARQR